MELLIMQFSQASHHFLFGQNILLGTLFSSTLNLCSLLKVKFYSHKKHTKYEKQW
jgi:hypothetical protein